jgi:hypothetical protein
VAFDPARRRLVLFGGWRFGALADTWEWDGASWVQQSPVASPPAVDGPTMAFDGARQRVATFTGGALWYFLP